MCTTLIPAQEEFGVFGMLHHKPLGHERGHGVGDLEIIPALHRRLPTHAPDNCFGGEARPTLSDLQRKADEHRVDGWMFRHPLVSPCLGGTRLAIAAGAVRGGAGGDVVRPDKIAFAEQYPSLEQRADVLLLVEVT